MTIDFSTYRPDPIDEGYWNRLHESNSVRLTHELQVLRTIRYFDPEREEYRRREIDIVEEFKRRNRVRGEKRREAREAAEQS